MSQYKRVYGRHVKSEQALQVTRDNVPFSLGQRNSLYKMYKIYFLF